MIFKNNKENMTVGFEFGGNSIEIVNYKYSAEDANNGNPYNSSFQVKVVSGGFCGVAECEYDRKEWNKFIEQLELFYELKLKEIVFKDICYGSTITFIMDNMGHFTVYGKIYGLHMTHSMEFEFTADQTVLPRFISGLKKL